MSVVMHRGGVVQQACATDDVNDVICETEIGVGDRAWEAARGTPTACSVRERNGFVFVQKTVCGYAAWR
jgi:hypothetical protein